MTKNLKKSWTIGAQQADNEIKREQEEEATAPKEFEKQVTDTINTGAGDLNTAIKWIPKVRVLIKNVIWLCLLQSGLPASAMENEFKTVLA